MSFGFGLLTGAPRKLWISAESLLFRMQSGSSFHQKKIQCSSISSMRIR